MYFDAIRNSILIIPDLRIDASVWIAKECYLSGRTEQNNTIKRQIAAARVYCSKLPDLMNQRYKRESLLND